MARYRPRKPKPAHQTYRKARSSAAILRQPRLRDLVGDDPFGLITQVGEAILAAREADFEVSDRAFGFEDFWDEDER
jgi:hypothetical protein